MLQYFLECIKGKKDLLMILKLYSILYVNISNTICILNKVIEFS